MRIFWSSMLAIVYVMNGNLLSLWFCKQRWRVFKFGIDKWRWWACEIRASLEMWRQLLSLITSFSFNCHFYLTAVLTINHLFCPIHRLHYPTFVLQISQIFLSSSYTYPASMSTNQIMRATLHYTLPHKLVRNISILSFFFHFRRNFHFPYDMHLMNEKKAFITQDVNWLLCVIHTHCMSHIFHCNHSERLSNKK